jgi:hypothetical protein
LEIAQNSCLQFAAAAASSQQHNFVPAADSDRTHDLHININRGIFEDKKQRLRWSFIHLVWWQLAIRSCGCCGFGDGDGGGYWARS